MKWLFIQAGWTEYQAQCLAPGGWMLVVAFVDYVLYQLDQMDLFDPLWDWLFPRVLDVLEALDIYDPQNGFCEKNDRCFECRKSTEYSEVLSQRRKLG